MAAKKNILSKEVAQKKLRRMALQVAEQNYDVPEMVLIGIKENGLVIAEKIAIYLREAYNGTIAVIALTVDKQDPIHLSLFPEMDYKGKTILLVDDVSNSGRTMLYSLKPLLNDYPHKIQTLALVERTYKSFPIKVDYVGLTISTNPTENIQVEVLDGEVNGAWIEEALHAPQGGIF